MSDPLALLRDIHLPPAPDAWPPAPAVWVLVSAAVLFAALAWGWHRRRRTPRAAARREWRRIARAYRATRNEFQLAAALSALLRRAARATGGPSTAGLAGRAWAAYLAQHAPAAADARAWECLALERYRPEGPGIGGEALLRQCRRWLDHRLP